MDGSGLLAVAAFVVPIAVGIAMAIHPEWKFIGWIIICVCVGVFFWAAATYWLTRHPIGIATLTKTVALAAACAGAAVMAVLALTIEVPHGSSSSDGAYLRLQFYGDTRVPKEVRESNVATWFAYYSPSAQVREGTPNGPGRVIMTTPKTWAIFLAYDRPTEVRQIVVSFNAPGLPPYQVLQSTKSAALISFAQDIPAGEVEIEVLP